VRILKLIYKANVLHTDLMLFKVYKHSIVKILKFAVFNEFKTTDLPLMCRIYN